MKKHYWITICLTLLLNLALWDQVLASGTRDDGRWVALVSTRVDCIAVSAGAPDSTSATVRLEWTGQVEQAYLLLSPSGSRGGHSIYVNGQRVGSVPARPGGQVCQVGSPTFPLLATDSIPIPVEALVRGENVITLTNDADNDDGWTATNLRLEIHGVLEGLPPAALETTPTSRSIQAATEVISDSVWLQSSYELAQGRDDIFQLVSYQIPDSYTDTVPTPLLIALHGMSSNGQIIRDYLAAEANARGWLLAAPDRHGRYLVDSGENALAYVGAQHDVMDTVAYMMANYEVDLSRIYVTGRSMGGQTTAMMGAKYPDVFAAATPWKPLTDLSDWYYELEVLLGSSHNILQDIREEVGGTPTEVPFEYQRRSPMEMPQNSRLVPIKMWHDVDDILVPIHHSRDLRNAINSWEPPMPVTLIEVPSGDLDCPPDGGGNDFEHCYNPPPTDIFDFLDDFTLDTNPPLSLTIRTDESKSYYWLNFAQTGGDHWSEAQAVYSLANKTVTATISDAQPLTLGLNLGSTPTTDFWGLSHSGIGLPATTYLVSGGGNYKLENYTSGYLTTTLTTTGQFTLTISAVTAELSAVPALVSGWQTVTSVLTLVAKDHLNNPVPDGTSVQFFATEGTFPNETSTVTAIVTGGQATTILTLPPTVELVAEITASVESVSATTVVDIIHPAIDLLAKPYQSTVYQGNLVTFTYQFTNTGDITLTAVTVSVDGSTVCDGFTLAAGATQECVSQIPAPSQTAIITTAVTGQDPLGSDVTDSDSTTVVVISPTIDLLVRPHQGTVYQGDLVTFTYQFTNTGDTTLTAVTVSVDGGIVCDGFTLAAGATQDCISQIPALSQTTTIKAVVNGQDPLGGNVTDSDSTTVVAISPTIDLLVRSHQDTVYQGDLITFTYQFTNTGDITLTAVTVSVDGGTVCDGFTLAAGETQECISQIPALSQTTIITAVVTGQDPLGNNIADSDSATVVAISPTIDLLVRPHQGTVYQGDLVTFTYQFTNTGGITLTAVTVSVDGSTVCDGFTLAAGETQECVSQIPALSQTATITAVVTGQDPLGSNVADSDSVTVVVISPAIEIRVTPHQTVIYGGGLVTFTYQVINSGDITLTGVTVMDDDVMVCEGIVLAAGAAQGCTRGLVISQTTTITSTVVGQDPLGYDVIANDLTIVIVRPSGVSSTIIYLPTVTRNHLSFE